MVKDSPQNNDAFVLAEIAAVRSGVSVPWPRVSILLRTIEQTGFWQQEADSFTNWINLHSGALGIKPPSLWRFFAAGRYYESFRSEYPELCPLPLEQLPGRVSPESLELLYKLARVAPRDVVSTLLKKILDCSARRSELRAAWLAYRPIMEGRTARGRGVAPPKINDPEAKQAGQIIEATVIQGLISSPPAWTGIQGLLSHRVYILPGNSNLARFDAVVVTRGRTSGLLFHGIEVKSRLNFFMAGSLAKQAKGCDLFWVALPVQPQKKAVDALAKEIGVIVVDRHGVQVVRPAQFSNERRNTGELAKIILEQEIAG